MQISFYIGNAYFNGTATRVNRNGGEMFFVELDNQQAFHARVSENGNWASDHTKGNKLIYDMVCAAGSEIAFRLALPDLAEAEPGSYEPGCGMKDCPAERTVFKEII
jgi:hypothetical protein